MLAAHSQEGWAVVLALFVLIVLITFGILLRERGRLRRQRDTLQARATDVHQAIDGIAQTMNVALFYLRQEADGRRSFPFVAGRTERFLDGSAREIMTHGDCWLQRLPETDRAVVEQAIQRSIADLRPIFADVRMQRADGIGWIRLATSLPQTYPDGSIVWKGYWADITSEYQQAQALARAKADAEASAEAKARFLAAMSHEIRTPLATVISALDLLRGTSLDAGQRANFDLADSAARLLMEIIGDILDFSRLEASDAVPESVPFSPRSLLEQVLHVFDIQVRRKGLELSLDIDSRVAPWLRGDPAHIKQIALNLVGNAVKFTERGSIRVALQLESAPGDDPQHIVLSVADTGIGIAESAQQRLFEPFVQATASTARHYGGSGLGLSVCHRLVTLMGGTIRFSSVLGQGSTFEARLPLPVAAGPEPAAGPAAQASQASGPTAAAAVRVLVADDHAPYRMILGQLLTKLGLQFDAVADGEQALAALAAAPYAMLITDCHMPGMDGCELARRIRQQEASTGRRLPIIAMTADIDTEQVRRCEESGIDATLIKPITASALRQCVDNWIRP